MLKNQNIICISSIDWDFIWQQHQTIMSAFAERGSNNQVLFIENTGVRAPVLNDIPRLKKRIVNWSRGVKGFRKERENLYIYSPLILPFPYSKIAHWINRRLLVASLKRWMKVVGFHVPIIWTFLPTPLTLSLANEIPHKVFIYYCTDNFSATSKAAKKIVKYEKKVLQKADAIFVMAKNMVGYCSRFNRNVTCVPMGLDTERFIGHSQVDIKPAEMENINNRIIGYIGGVRSSIDQALVEFLANQLPDFTFVFIGPFQTDASKLKKYKNIIFTGQKPHTELPGYIKYFDVCIIPYLKNDYTDNISAAKLNEYLIMGKPVVSTNLKEVKNFNKDNGNILYIADDRQEFVNFIREAIKQDNEILRSKRIKVARNNSWDKKIEQMSEIVETTIRKKEENVAVNWQERLLEIYKVVRRKIIRITFALFLLWLLIFYTPFIWFLAAPLKISQTPQKANAIVVFAGGVGESGKAGQGYEERVQYAVELYRQGYAGYMIFSSGYMYAFKEPLVMEALAVSLGAPKGAIILEDKAANTYQNVEFSKNILAKKNWNKILLISSPYNMRRVSLVADKIAPGIKIIYTPIPQSRFYRRGIGPNGKKAWKQVNLRQIKGIVHEYLGIVYYWWKGYI